jgi:hypothetical protein
MCPLNFCYGYGYGCGHGCGSNTLISLKDVAEAIVMIHG